MGKKKFTPPLPDDRNTLELLASAALIWNEKGMQQKLFNADGSRKIQFSDIEDADGYQYVDLVQEGGGMLGIALVGFTYVLEKMAKIKFVSLAGTSAGGINAMMLAAVPDSIYQEGRTKSEVAAGLIATKNFYDFVDATWLKKQIIGFLFNGGFTPFKKRLLVVLGVVSYFGIASGFYWLMSAQLVCESCFSTFDIKLMLYALGTIGAFLPLVIFYVFMRIALGPHFGLNPGKVFANWIKDILEIYNVHTTTDLYRQMPPPKIKNLQSIREGKSGDEKPLCRRLVLITANVTHHRIAKFPEGAGDYWSDLRKVPPHNFVRATMSIPFFFQVFEPEGEVALYARFVDGGMLSNFPIREFHNYSIATPRFPTFGIKLGLEAKPHFLKRILLTEYLLALFTTFRKFYDNDFLADHGEYQYLVSTINTKDKHGKEINWLQFDMPFETKKVLFENGARAAMDFLEGFQWEKYKDFRRTGHSNITGCTP